MNGLSHKSGGWGLEAAGLGIGLESRLGVGAGRPQLPLRSRSPEPQPPAPEISSPQPPAPSPLAYTPRMIRRKTALLIAFGAFGAFACIASRAGAEVTRVDIAGRAAIGASGYEKVFGTAHFAIDPKDPRNRVIVDLEKAAVNAQGKVEFSADFYLMRPTDASTRQRRRARRGVEPRPEGAAERLQPRARRDSIRAPTPTSVTVS